MNTRCASTRQQRVRHLFSPLVLALIVVTVVSVTSLTAVHGAGLGGRPTDTIQPGPEQGSQPIASQPQPVPGAPQTLIVPPPGGLTLGFSGTTSPAALLAAQTFEVASITVVDIASQEFLVHIPAAPDFVNSLTEDTLTPDAVVILRRVGEPSGDAIDAVSRAITEPSGGVPFALATPPEGGLTMGMTGTNDLQALIGAQAFEVSTVSLFHIEGQRWLVFIPGAPDGVSSLTAEFVAADSFVAMRRLGPAPEPATATAAAAEADSAEAAVEPDAVEDASGDSEATLRSLGVGRISYYYCEKGSNSGAWGDGGGWCGHFSSGERVYEGGAACAGEYRGQRFKIAGDPYDRVYVCEDIGGAVHGNTRDIFFWNSDTASQWIRQVGYEAEIFVVE